jgi:pimeloyl-ACP methyl ester carboxylesterase
MTDHAAPRSPFAAAGPFPLEIPTAHGTLRGHRWIGGPCWALFVHEPGADLDAWGALPAALAALGDTVLVLDLPGHGLSDDPARPDGAAIVARAVWAAAAQGQATRRFLVAAGASVADALAAGPVDALIALSPTGADALDASDRSPCLLIVGGQDATQAADADAFFRAKQGWIVQSVFGEAAFGAGLARSTWAGHVEEQTIAFLRDFRPHPPTAAPVPKP